LVTALFLVFHFKRHEGREAPNIEVDKGESLGVGIAQVV